MNDRKAKVQADIPLSPTYEVVGFGNGCALGQPLPFSARIASVHTRGRGFEGFSGLRSLGNGWYLLRHRMALPKVHEIMAIGSLRGKLAVQDVSLNNPILGLRTEKEVNIDSCFTQKGNQQ